MSLPITRFAPSPTGHLHVGGARTALFDWALARHLGGHFLLRIEDTDQARNSREAVRGILEDLAWLGIHWDEGPVPGGADRDPRGVGPFFQSERLARYDAAIGELVAKDLAYPAFETTEELEALRAAASAEKRAFRYVRPAGFDREAALARLRAGEPHVVRLRAPDETIVVADRILGEIAFGPEQIDDFVLRKRDGFPTYHLAVVVDDEAMGVTHVLRGPEHLNNTPKHIALQRALGYATPIYAHVPSIQNPDGSKMSKRDKDRAARALAKEAFARAGEATWARAERAVPPQRLEAWLRDAKSQLETSELDALADALGLDLPGVTVEDFRRAGYLPETVVNYLALLGWSPGEKLADGRDREQFDMAYLAQRFSLERVGRGNAKFDRAKLAAFSQEQLAAFSDETWLARWRTWCARYAPELPARLGDETRALLFARAMKTRCRTLAEASAPGGPGRFALVADDAFVYDPGAVAKWLAKGEPSGLVLLAEARSALAPLEPFTPAAIEAEVARLCAARGLGLGRLAQPLRVALTGTAASPPLGETLAILGRASVLARIDRCLASDREAPAASS
jgi:glutamyl-tRNA synthetase